MKATKTSREAADLVDVRRNGEGGTTYRCLKCGFKTESNTYYEPDYKAMLDHAANCDGRGAPSETRAVATQSRDAQRYGDGKELSHMAWRIKNCVPNGNRLEDNEALSLAQIALATGLNPFIGELWYISGKGPMAGIRGLRRRAREQSTYSTDFRAMKPDEHAEHGIGPNDIGRICELYRHDVLQRAVEINKAAGKAVVPIKPILGVGIWRKGDQIPAGKSSTWVADKRAEADALRKGFDLTELPYTDEVNGSQLDVADIEDADWSFVPGLDEEIIRREAAINGERMAQASAAPSQDLGDVIAKYQDGELEAPSWVEELRDEIRAHPKASDALDSGNGMIRQLKLSAGRTIEVEQFKAAVEIICDSSLEELTFGQVAVMMNSFVNGPDFEARVVALLS